MTKPAFSSHIPLSNPLSSSSLAKLVTRFFLLDEPVFVYKWLVRRWGVVELVTDLRHYVCKVLIMHTGKALKVLVRFILMSSV